MSVNFRLFLFGLAVAWVAMETQAQDTWRYQRETKLGSSSTQARAVVLPQLDLDEVLVCRAR